MNGIYLLLGTNIGDRIQYLNNAIDLLNEQQIKTVQKSAVYESEAWGKENQQAFLNQVIQVETTYAAQKLLENILMIERQMGRIRLEKWGERIIDIDILFYNNLIINSDQLTIPHPLIQERKFTLLPLVELAPDAIHPILKTSSANLLKNCNDPLSVYKL